MKYEELTDNELIQLANEKVKNTGSFKKTAIKAQIELWNRKHWPTKEPKLSQKQLDGKIDIV